MEPRIQYATTKDGVSIAFWSIGEGPALLIPPPASPWSHIEMEWQIPEWRHWYEHLAETMRVIRYDNRGSGLSDRNYHDFKMEEKIADMQAVIDRLQLDRVALFGCYFAALPSIAYAAAHPERVTHLMLWCGLSQTKQGGEEQELREALTTLLHRDYNFFTETLTHSIFGWEQGESAHQLALYMQAALTQAEAIACWEANVDLNLDHLLPAIAAPALVMHRREFKSLTVDTARRLAAAIPDARLKVFDGSSISPYMGDQMDSINAVNDFMGVSPPADGRLQRPHAHAGEGATGGFRVIMFTDMEDSTATTQRIGDAQAQRLVRLHNAIVNEALQSSGGTQVKHTGDGIMASFPTASGAVDAAIEIQRAFERHNADSPDDRVNVRIGINAGEPVIEGDDLFGTAVQLASRVCARAQPGEILTTDVVRQLVAGKGFLFSDNGEAELRGFEDPVRVFEVRWRTGG